MITFKEHREKSTQSIKDLPDNLSAEELVEATQTMGFAIQMEIQEFIWNLLVLMGQIIKFLVVNSIKTIWGSGKFLYRRYNKQGRADRRFNKQMKKTSKQIKKLRMAKGKYQNAILRLDNMKDALESMSNEDKVKHKKEIQGYYNKIADIQLQANEALKKLKSVK